MFDRFITYRARQAPHAVAVSMPAAEVGYADLDAAISRAAAALRETAALYEAGRPERAAICVADPYRHWLILLALARLGIASASVAAGQEQVLLPLLRPDLVVADGAQPVPLDGVRWLHASENWIGAALRRSDGIAAHNRVRPDPGSLAHVAFSSGSTGRPKMIGLTWAQVDARILHAAASSTQGSLARTLPILDAGTAALVRALTAWLGGGTLLITTREPTALAAALTALHPTMLVASPIQFRLILDALPPGFLPLPGLRIVVGGSHTPMALRSELRLRLASDLLVAYGSTEAGFVSAGPSALLGEDEAACGWLATDAEARVVDDAGQALAHGESGHILLAGPEVASGYLDDPEGTAEHFQEGWYRSGDVGTLSEDGLLRVEGRADERMNFGGVKLLPLLLEEAALTCPGVRDAGAFARADAAGIPQPWLALVRDNDLDPAVLDRTLRARLPGLPPIRVAWIAAIPRNAGGKIERERLARAAAALDAFGRGA